MSFKFDVRGTKKLDKFLRSSEPNIQKAKIKSFKRVGLILTKEVKINTPVKKGILRRSVQYIFSKDLLEVFTRIFYGPFVEDGTRYQKPKHMFKNTYDKYKDKILDLLVEEIDRNLR